MNKSDRGWFALIIVVHYLVGMSLFYLVSWWAYTAWLVLGVPIGYVAAKFFKRRHKQTLIEEWRRTHPDLSDYWLPKKLKDVA